MGKIHDERVVEYAYLLFVEVTPNEPSNEEGTEYKHRVRLRYDLLGVDRKRISLKSVDHYTDAFSTQETVDEARTRVDVLMHGWIRTDKLEFSGYDIGT